MCPIAKPHMFGLPFAANGEKAIPPDTQQAQGHTSLDLGFPVETGIPIRSGGIAPSRTDMNGLGNLLSQHIVYQQAGGLYSFDAAIVAQGGYPKGAVLAFDNPAIPLRVRSLVDNNITNFNNDNAGIGTVWAIEGPGVVSWNAGVVYSPPCLVFGADGLLFMCLQENGPGTAGGVRQPGGNAGYWVDYASTLKTSLYKAGDRKDFYHSLPVEGWVEVVGYVLQNASEYPELIAFLESPEGQAQTVTKEEYDARHNGVKYTYPDGRVERWNGQGGVAVFAWDKENDVVYFPDLRGIDSITAGADAPGVGECQTDASRPFEGDIGGLGTANGRATGIFESAGNSGAIYGVGGSSWAFGNARLSAARQVPTGETFHGARYGVSTRICIGKHVPQAAAA